MQTGMKLDSKTPECRKFLVKLMDQLETVSPVPVRADPRREQRWVVRAVRRRWFCKVRVISSLPVLSPRT